MPHTAESLLEVESPHPYSHEQATDPLKARRRSKYWAPMGRMANVLSDRNLVCRCVPTSEFEN